MDLKSLHIIGSKEAGGAERFFLRLTSALVSAGHPCEVIVPKQCRFTSLVDPRIPVFPVAMSNIFDLFSGIRIRNIIRTRKPDIVQTYMGRATRLTHVPSAWGIPHIARLGGYYNLKGYRHASAWIGNTRGIADYLRKGGLPSERVFQIGNFVPVAERVSLHDLQRLRQELSIPEHSRVVLAVGRLHPNKAFDTLLHSFARMVSLAPQHRFHLLILGDGPERAALAALTEQLQLGQLVRWAGWQNDPNPYYQFADLFVCPSRHEPLGNVILEAWSNRCPVVSTRNQGAMELVGSGTEAALVNIDDVDGLSECMLGLLRDSEQRTRLADAGYQRLVQSHSEQSIVSAYVHLYRDLTGKT